MESTDDAGVSSERKVVGKGGCTHPRSASRRDPRVHPRSGARHPCTTIPEVVGGEEDERERV